ncbi:MAG: thioredoxin family protein [Ignavibacteriae bacterium]|nr:thioredoxin family protein [Ignavibacteriota bacterium]
MNIAIEKFFQNFKCDKLFSYEEYVKYYEQKVANTDFEKLSEHDRIYFEYSRINLQRTNRINKTFSPNKQLIDLFQSLNFQQTWLIITEDWCGDSAQNLPYFINYAKTNKNIEVFVILRDNNLEAIDNYFNSQTSRAIPKIIGFDENGNELFIWGPRPKFAQDLVNELKAEGYSKEDFNKELHLWYARNKGIELEKELIHIFKYINRKGHKEK